MPRPDIDSLSDEALVALAVGGDDRAMAALIARVSPIAKAKAAAYKDDDLRPLTEDLVQEGMFGFLNAVRTFSPDKEASFRTYADTCIGNRIISAVRSHRNEKNMALSSAVALPDEDKGLSDAKLDPQEIITSRESLQNFKAIIRNSADFSDFEGKVIRLRLSGKSYCEIAKELGKSEKAVDNALQRVRKKLRAKI